MTKLHINYLNTVMDVTLICMAINTQQTMDPTSNIDMPTSSTTKENVFTEYSTNLTVEEYEDTRQVEDHLQ